MQQVKSETFLAGARIVDPRTLPVPVRSSHRKLANNFGRVWVLHSTLIKRGLMVAALLAGSIGLYQLRAPIISGAMGLTEIAQLRFADAGLAIGEIAITGQTLTHEQAIFDALGVEPHTSTVSFDVEAARQRIAALPAVESVSVRKNFPGDIVVTITEKQPVARWRVDGVTFVVDASGEQIGEAGGAYADLPLVIGDGANDDALVMIRALDQYPRLKEGLVALSRIADRRWDMIYDTGLRVQLPELGVAGALRHLLSYQSDYQLLDRDLTIVDLRVAGIVALRPTKSEADLAKDEEERQAAIAARVLSPDPYPLPPRNLPSETLSEPILPQ